VAYAWSEVPDYASWFEAAKAVSDFVLQQACLNNRDEAWISELRPERRGFGRVQDLAAIQVPVTLLEAHQCATVLQTLFFRSNRRLASGKRRASRRHRRDESPNDSETSRDSRRAPPSSRDDMLTRSSVSGPRTRGTSRSSRTSSSRRSRTSSSGSGAAQVAMNVLHQTQDGLARMRMKQDRRLATLEERQESFLVRQHQAQLDARLGVDRQLQSAIRVVEALAGRLADMESQRQRAETTPSVVAEQVKVEDQSPASLDIGWTQDRVQKDVKEATRRERERVQAEYEERWRQHMAEVEQERARWTVEATRALGAQQEALAAERASFQQLKNTEEHRRSQRHNWKLLSTKFKKLYCRTTGSYAERYFTMKMRASETALQFFYRLNAAAVKAEIPFQTSSKRRELHLRRFVKKLKDVQLKTALDGHQFQSISEVERILRRHEDVWREDGYEMPPTRTRDARADNLPRGGLKPRRPGHAFLTQNVDSGNPPVVEKHVQLQTPEVEEQPRVADPDQSMVRPFDARNGGGIV
ncbi:hypothetical protein PHMEG_00021114, partial [Phytophthora megakarya]